MNLSVTLPKLHAKQADFVNSPAKRKVIVAGRRGGKTFGVSDLNVEAFLAGRRCLYAAPTQEQTDAFWFYAKEWLHPLIEAGVLKKNETTKTITWANPQAELVQELVGDRRAPEEYEKDGLGYSRIKAKTAWNADTLRGDWADLLTLEEFSLMDYETWGQVGVPMMLDTNGDAVFIYTPKRRNHAYAIYQRARADETGRWQWWHFTSHDNPYLSREALSEITQDMTEEDYRQEIEAIFLESEGMVYTNIDQVHTADSDPNPKDHNPREHHIVIGSDWGDRNDYTVHACGCATCGVELDLYRARHVGYTTHRQALLEMQEKWGARGALVERNSIGQTQIEEAAKIGVRLLTGEDGDIGFQTTGQTKFNLIRNSQLAYEDVSWRLLDHPVARVEAESYERKDGGIYPKFFCPAPLHDDTVMARALMMWAGRGVAPLPQQPRQVSRWMRQEETRRRNWSPLRKF